MERRCNPGPIEFSLVSAFRVLGIALAGWLALACEDDGGGPKPDGTGGAATTLSIVAGTPPPGLVGVSYSHHLSLEGGDVQGAWSIVGGELPPGLELDSSGHVHGAPSAEGRFVVEVQVDVGGQLARETLSISVSTKRWLAYLSDERLRGQDLLWVVDVSDAALPRTLLSTDVQPRGDVLPEDFAFSGSGRTIAFLVDRTEDNRRELLAVDLAGKNPGSPLVIHDESPVFAFAWSPRGDEIAFVAADGDTARVFVSDVPPSAQPAVVGEAAPVGAVSWVDPNTLVFDDPEGGARAVRRDDGGAFSSVGQFAARGGLLGSRGDLAVLGRELYRCEGQYSRIDLRTSQTARVGGFARALYSDDLELVTTVHSDKVSVHRAGDPDGSALATLELGPCEAVRWLPRERGLMTVDSRGRLVMTRFDANGTPTSREVGGPYGAVLPEPAPAADPEARLIKFHDAGSIYLSRASGESFESAYSLMQALSLSGAVGHSSRFSPSGGQLIFTLDEGGGTRARWVDVSGTTPSSSTDLFPNLPAGQEVREVVAWSAEGRRAAFLVREGPQGSAINLWVAGAGKLAGGSGSPTSARPVVPALECQTSDGVSRCETVGAPMFQP